MTDLETALRRIAAALEGRCFSWALVGGLAVGTHAEPRTTRDVDVVVAVSGDDQAEQLVAALRNSGFTVGIAIEHQALKRLATVRMGAPGTTIPVSVDLLFASSGIETEVSLAAKRIEIVAGLEIPVARPGHLVALKLLARNDRKRPQDYDDLKALLKDLDESELRLAREAVALIESRGANRGRDLDAALTELLDEFRPRRRR